MALALASSACHRAATAAGEGSEEAKAEPAVAEVTVTKVAREPIASLLQISGTIAALPNRDVKVSALVAGRVAEMLVTEGDAVKEGQMVARIDAVQQRDQARQAEAAVEQVKAQLDNAQLNLKRNETLFQRGIAAGKELEDARTQVSVAEATLRQATAALQVARLQVSRTDVHSPLSGTVVRRFVSTGEQVDGTAAQPLYQVAEMSEVELSANIPGTYLGSIHSGQKISMISDAFPGKQFTGQVFAIAPAVDPATNVGLVRIRLVNPAHALPLGLFLTGTIPLVSHPRALVVPPQAIYRNEESAPQVYRVNGGQVEAVAVELGIETRDKVELLSGVQEGDTLVLTGGYGLPDKTKIRIKQ